MYMKGIRIKTKIKNEKTRLRQRVNDKNQMNYISFKNNKLGMKVSIDLEKFSVSSNKLRLGLILLNSAVLHTVLYATTTLINQLLATVS